MQPLTRGPEADETKKDHDSGMATPLTSTRACATFKAAAAPSSAFDLCADALGVRSAPRQPIASPLGADTVCTSQGAALPTRSSYSSRKG